MWCYYGTFGISCDIPFGRKKNGINFTLWSLCVCEPFVASAVTLRLAEALQQCLLMWVHTHFTHLSEWCAAVYPSSPIFVHFPQVLGHSPSANHHHRFAIITAQLLLFHLWTCCTQLQQFFFACISPCFFHVFLQLCLCSLIYLSGRLFYRGGTK